MTPISQESLRQLYGVEPLYTKPVANIRRILLVGNSFLFYNGGVPGMMNGLAKKAGVPLTLTMAAIGGASLYWHDVKSYLRPNGLRSYEIASDGSNEVCFIEYENGKIFEAVVLEDSSQGPIHPALNKLYRKAAAEHVAEVRKSGAEPFFMMTWAYRDKPQMTRALADATIDCANANQAPVIPVGLAFAESRRLRPDIELIRTDNRHPRVAGTFLTSAVFFASLTGIDPTELDFKGRFDDLVVTDEQARFLRACAWQTVKTFNGW